MTLNGIPLHRVGSFVYRARMVDGYPPAKIDDGTCCYVYASADRRYQLTLTANDAARLGAVS